MRVRRYWRGLVLLAVVMGIILVFAQNDSEQNESGAGGWIQEHILGRGAVGALKLSPDGDKLALGSTIGVWLYHFPSLEEIAFILHDANVYSVSWSHDGTRLATGDWDGNVRIWDVQTETPRLLNRFSSGRGVVWSPVGEQLAIYEDWSSTGYGDTVWVMDMEKGKVTQNLKAQIDDRLAYITWSADGKRIAAASYDGNYYLWDVMLTQPQEVSIYIDYDHLATSDEDISLTHFAETGGELQLLRNENISPDGRHLFQFGEDVPLRVLDAATGETLILLEDESDPVRRFRWSKNGSQFVTLRRFGKLEVWDVASGSVLAQKVHYFNGSGMRDVAWSPDGTHLVAGGDDGILQLWDLRSGERTLLQEQHEEVVRQVTWSPDGAFITSVSGSGGYEGDLRVWDATNGQLLAILTADFNECCVVGLATWSPDGSLLIAYRKKSGNSPIMLAWEAVSWSPVPTPAEANTWFSQVPLKEINRIAEDTRIRSSALSPDGTQLALGRWEGTVILQDASSGRLLHVFDEGENLRGLSAIKTVAWSPDGTRIAAGGGADTLWIWDVAKRKLLAEFEEPAFPIFGMEWSPDGSRLATTGQDGVVRIWRAP